jgi:hypothetical protein
MRRPLLTQVDYPKASFLSPASFAGTFISLLSTCNMRLIVGVVNMPSRAIRLDWPLRNADERG